VKVLSLFSGAGGFDVGLEAAGMQTVFQCEYDKHCLSVLERHWPDVPRWGDVSTLTGAYILEHAPVIDVVAWGSPCQDLSVAGKRGGLEGKQSNLFYEGIRIIKELRELTNGQYPRISIWENVVGAITSNNGNDFGVILDEMAKAGALVQEWAVLDAQYFGVPQRRRRIFVLTAFDPAIANNCPNPILPVAQSMRGNTPTRKQKRERTTSTANGSIAGNSSEQQPILIDRAAFNQGVNALYEPYISDDPIGPSLVARGPHAIAVEVYVKSRRAHLTTDHETWVQRDVTPTLNSFDVGEIRATTAIVEPMFAFDTQFGSNANVTENVSPTLKSSQQSPSVAYTDEQMVIRRLTPLECERLMGWPDDHTRWKADGTEQSDTTRYKQCGNGVASPVAQWIGKQIISL
jgi:DNA (cytosine-5)-methyltransferase 1